MERLHMERGHGTSVFKQILKNKQVATEQVIYILVSVFYIFLNHWDIYF